MKKTRIITLLGSLTLALGGLVAFSQVSKKGNFEEAKAAALVPDTDKKFIFFEPGVWDVAGAKLWLHPFSGDNVAFQKFELDELRDVYYASVNKDVMSFTFVRGTNTGGGVGDWDNVWDKTDYTFNDEKNYLKVENWNNYSQHFYNPNGTNKALLMGDYGAEPAWSQSTAIDMVKNGDKDEIMATIPLKKGNKFRIYTDDKLDPYWNTQNTHIKDSSQASVEKDGDDFKAKSDLEEGAYVIYYTYSGYDTGVYIAKTNDDVKSLSCYIMQSDAEGQCSTKFYSARTRFLAMSPENRVSFQSQASDPTKAAYRYEAWARALGEKPYENGKASSTVLNVLDLNKDNNAGIIVIVIATAISLTAVAGFFYFRKRKHI